MRITPLETQSIIAGVCLWLGLAVLVVTLILVRDPRRLRRLLAIGIALLAVALALLVTMPLFGPDVVAP